MKMLVTGFEPFGKLKQNPSKSLVQELKKQKQCETVLLKTEYRESEKKLVKSLKRLQPDILLMTGLAAGLPKLHLERFALNLDDCSLADNSGEKRKDRPIAKKASLALNATLPLRPILKKLERNFIPAGFSNSAGTYVCNHIFYFALDYIQKENLPIAAGFMHLPCTTKQVCQENLNLPSMPLELMVQAVSTVLDTCQEINLQL